MSTAAQAAWYERNKDRIAEERQIMRRAVLVMYGGECECCHETHLNFLVIDHRHGGGNAEKRAIGKFGNAYLRTLLSQPRRLDLRVLCWNCNMALGMYGACHEVS